VLLFTFRPGRTKPAQVENLLKVRINGAWNLNHSAVNHKYIISCPHNHCRNIAGKMRIAKHIARAGALRGIDLVECICKPQIHLGIREAVIPMPVKILPPTQTVKPEAE
jgi:hypothetical protein